MFAGGMDWVALGSQIHEDTLQSMQFLSSLMNTEWQKRQKEKEDAESKRRFNITAEQTGRSQNLSALDYLSGQRAMAGASKRSFDDAISKAIRSY
jgi:hypothetical protein